jgi:hypothetical protein
MSMSKETRFIWGGIFVVVVLLLVFTCGAHASPGDDGCVGNCDDGTGNTGSSPITNTVTNTNNPSNTNKVSNTNRNTNNSKAIATGGIGYGGNATSRANSISSGGNAVASNGPQTTTVSVVENNPGNIRYGGSYTVKSVGVAPDISTYSTAPCRVAIGASGGWIGGAIGFSGSVLDEGCDIWRDHVNLRAAGHIEEANIRLCDKPELKKVMGAKCATVEEVQGSSVSFHSSIH